MRVVRVKRGVGHRFCALHHLLINHAQTITIIIIRNNGVRPHHAYHAWNHHATLIITQTANTSCRMQSSHNTHVITTHSIIIITLLLLFFFFTSSSTRTTSPLSSFTFVVPSSALGGPKAVCVLFGLFIGG
jgi:hypothetical protein